MFAGTEVLKPRVCYVMLGGLPGSEGSDGKYQFAEERLERMWIISDIHKKLL